jgi:PAS domain S-box-containing protein
MSATTDEIHILHVDDEPAFADLAATFLQRQDERFDVETATSAIEGLDRLDETDFDCIVSDYEMPRRNGLEFLDAVRGEYPQLPFILFTGKGSEEVASEAISAGVTDYLQKQGSTSQYTVLANRIRNAVEQYRAERKVEASQKRLSLFIEQSPLGVLEYNEAFEIVRVNRKGEEILGYDESELLGHTWEKLVTEDSYDAVDRVTDDLAEAKGGYHIINENVRKDGERIVCEWHNRVVTDEDGNAVTIISQFQDVTERRTQQEQLERYRTVVDAAMNTILTVDESGTILSANQSIEDTFGYAPAELVGEPLTMLMPDAVADQHTAGFEHYLETGEKTLDWDHVEFDGRHRDGSIFPLAITFGEATYEEEQYFVGILRDITEDREREQALEQTNALLSTLIETLPVGVLAEDNSRNVLAVNQRLFEMFGMPGSPEAVTGSDCEVLAEQVSDLFVDDEVFVERINELVAAREPTDDETLALSDGRTFERSYRPIELPDGEGHLWTYRDTTARRERERELERARDLFERTERIADVGGWEIDTETMEVFWTDHLFELLGVDADESPPLDEALDIYHEADRPIVESAIEDALDTGEPFDVDVRFRRPDGEIRWLRVRGTPAVEDGEVVALRGAVRDITDQQERERELEQSRESFKALFNGMNDTAWVIDIGGTFRAVNDAAVETTGYSRAELLSMTPHDIDAGLDDDELTNLVETMPDDGVQIFETVHETKDGEHIPVEISSSLVWYQGDEAVLSIGRDISNRKQREEQLEQFASIVSHDLRNPLNVAEGKLELARDECDSKSLDGVARAHDRMDALIEDLLTLAREGRDVGDMEAVDLASLAESCWRNVATAGTTLETDTERTVRADRSRLQQLVENLVRNAVEHGSTGSQPDADDAVEHGSTDVTVTVGELENGFYVEDDGVGIPEAERGDVFEAGYSTAGEGTGFGLAIVKRIADAHGWNIRVTTGESGGARFEITGVEFADD